MSERMSAVPPRRQSAEACLSWPTTGPVHRWHALELVRENMEDLGLKDRDLSVLQALLSLFEKNDLDPSRINVIYARKAEVARRANNMHPRTITRCETRLEGAGIINRRLSANCRRFPIRIGGQIVDAYGIDFAPLLHRQNELLQMREDRIARQELRRYRETRISVALSQLSRHVRAAGTAACETVKDMLQAGHNLRRRINISEADVSSLEAKAQALLEARISGAEAHRPAEAKSSPAPCPADISARNNGQDLPTCERNPVYVSDRMTVDDRHSVRHIESPKKEHKTNRNHRIFEPGEIAACWSKLSNLNTFYAGPPLREREALGLIYEFCNFLDFDKRQAIETTTKLGVLNMLVLLDYLSLRLPTIKSPCSYVASLVREFAAGRSIAGGRIKAPF